MGINYIGIEAGGTKVVCATGNGPGSVSNRQRIPTTTPDETLSAITTYVREAHQADPTIAGLGLATFGPVIVDPADPAYGRLATTPKPGWSGTDLLGQLTAAFDGPIGLDTDVNGAAIAERRWGAGRDLASVAYVTVGTGIGVGAVLDGKPVHGLAHPEMGHIVVRRHPEDSFAGRCPSHGDCLEGLACGPAWLDRWGIPSSEMDAQTRKKAVDIQAYYMGQLMTTIVLAYSSHRIVVGGGVLGEPSLLPAVQAATRDFLAGYLVVPALQGDLSNYIVAPGLGGDAGILGAFALAEAAAGG